MSIKKLPKSQIELESQIDVQAWKVALDKAAAEISEQLKIAGFRPGKAPRNLVEEKAGKEAVINNAAERVIKKDYPKLVEKEKLEVIGSPKVEILEADEQKGLRYRATISVMPEVSLDENYGKDIKKINQEFAKKSDEVDEKELALELEKLANSRVKLITVRRAAQKGDSVIIDFKVLVGGVPIENGTSKNHPMVIGKGVFIPGFEDNIIGMKENEEKEFELTFPKDYHQKDLAGKKATFKVKVNLVQERKTPEIDDDFAKSLGKFENLSALKKSLREGMKEENKKRNKENKRTEYLQKLGEHLQVDLPEILIDQETQNMLSEFDYQVQSMGMDLESYLKQIKKDREELKKDWRNDAQKRVVGSLALRELSKMKNLEAKSEEVEAEMNKTLAYYKNVKDAKKNIDMERLYNYSKGVVENEKVFDYLEKL